MQVGATPARRLRSNQVNVSLPHKLNRQALLKGHNSCNDNHWKSDKKAQAGTRAPGARQGGRGVGQSSVRQQYSCTFNLLCDLKITAELGIMG